VANVTLKVNLDASGAIKSLALVDDGMRSTGKSARALEGALGATPKALAAGLPPAISGMKGLSDTLGTSTSKAAGFADSVGRVSTTLARSASVFGLPAGALRTLDDAADVAELGLANLSKSAAGFNAASLGVVGAGLAIGTMLGGLAREIPAVAAAADAAASSLHKMFTGIDPKAGIAGLKEWQAEIAKTHQAAMARQASGVTDKDVETVVKLAEANKKLKEASELVGRPITDLAQATRILTVAEAASAAGMEKHAAEMKRLSEAAKQAAAEQAKELYESQKRVDALTQSFLALSNAGGFVVTTMREVGQETQTVTNYQVPLIEGIRQHVQESINAAKADASRARVTQDVVAEMVAHKQITKEQAQAFLEAEGGCQRYTSSLEGLAGALSGAVQIADALGNALGQLGVSAQSGIGKAVSGVQDLAHAGVSAFESFMKFKSGDIFGGIASGIQALAGVVSGFKKIWDGVFGNKEIMHVNDLRDAFLSAHGGWLALQKELAQFSTEDIVKKIFDAKSVDEFNRAVQEALDALAKGKGAVPTTSPAGGDYGQVGAGPTPEEVPHYAMGTTWVPQTGLAVVHRGERIVPARMNRGSGGGSARLGGGTRVEYNVQIINNVPFNTNESNEQLSKLIYDRAAQGAEDRVASLVRALEGAAA
jgi:polyhydroxyalkanoate synthesis regulator phasin